jgi:hypothetical protein
LERVQSADQFNPVVPVQSISVIVTVDYKSTNPADGQQYDIPVSFPFQNGQIDLSSGNLVAQSQNSDSGSMLLLNCSKAGSGYNCMYMSTLNGKQIQFNVQLQQ